MGKMINFLFLFVLLLVINTLKTKYPEKWGKYETKFNIIWTILSIILIGIMGFSAWYMFAKSNADTETKIVHILITLGLIIFLAVFTVSTWKKKK